MPAQRPEQQKLMGIAYSVKQGKTPRSYSPEATELADSMTEKQLKEYASFPNPNAVLDMFLLFTKGWWF